MKLQGYEVVVGSRLYNMMYGWGEVIRIVENVYGPSIHIRFGNGANSLVRACDTDGRLCGGDAGPSIFWDVPEIPKKPPAKVKKYFVVYRAKNGGCYGVSLKKYQSLEEYETANFLLKAVALIDESEEIFEE